MRSAYNTGGVSSSGGVSDCAGLQSIGAAITSAATGTEKTYQIILNSRKNKMNLKKLRLIFCKSFFSARNSQEHLNHRSAASVAASAAAASMFGPGMGLNCK